MNYTIYYKLAIVVLVISFVLLGYINYTNIPRDSYTLETEAIVNKPEYDIGETLQWSVTLCKLHDAPFYSKRVLENQETGSQYPIPEFNTKSTLKKGECQRVSPSIIIPRNSNLEPGPYKLRSEIYPLDSNLNYKTFEYYTNEFQIK